MTDLISYAQNSMNPSGDSGSVPIHNETKAAAYLAACGEAKGLSSSQRCNVWRRFIKQHSPINDDRLKQLIESTISTHKALVGLDSQRDDLPPQARTFPTLTVSNVLKYMPEQALQFAALMTCFPSAEEAWIIYGLDTDFCHQDDAFSSGFVLGLGGAHKPHLADRILSRHDHLALNVTPSAVEPAKPTATELPDLDPAVQAMLDATLSGAGVPDYDALRELVAEANKPAPEPASSGVSITIGDYTKPKGSGDMPDMVAIRPVKPSALGLPTKHDMPMPTFEWSFTHPDVPEKVSDYHFRADLVDNMAYAITTNQRIWLHGHTGTGKSSLVDQVAARLNYPVVRVNFDGEISRMDLIGREVLRQENGTTVSQFVDGIIPNAMQRPCILLLDEIDFVRQEVAYVLQRLLETDGELVITEDGGRRIKADPMFRIVATANTLGQGNESGHYVGARAQSAAFLDRFTVWSEVDYLERDQIETMSGNSTIAAYYAEHVAAFKDGQVDLPLSPRGITAWAKMSTAIGNSTEAFEATLLNRASPADRAVMKGIMDRVVA